MASQGKLTINCSPGTFRRVEEDPVCRQRVLQEVAGENFYVQITISQQIPPSAYEVEPSENMPIGLHAGTSESVAITDASGSNCAVSSSFGVISKQPTAMVRGESDSEDLSFLRGCSSDADRKVLGLDAPTKLLLARVKDLRPQVGKTVKLKNKKQMWNTISEELCSKGYLYGAAQVEGKFFSLERQYKKVQLHNSQTGRSRQTCPFQAELDDILQERVSINPEFVLDSDQPADASFQEDQAQNLQAAPATPENVGVTPSTSRKRRRTTMDLLLDKMDKEAKKQEKRDNELKELLEKNLQQKQENAANKNEVEKKNYVC